MRDDGTRHRMFAEFFPIVLPVLPIERPDGQLFPYSPPSLEAAQAVASLVERFDASLGDAGMYAEDFLVEMQNRLVGDLFGHTVAHRAPLDPSKKVISLDHFEELEAWFNMSTEWGRECARIEEQTRQRFSSSATETVTAG